MTTAEVQALCASVARQVTGAYARRCEWTDREELEQEAWCAMLTALPGFDPARGDLGGYLYGTAQRAVHRFAWRQGSALSARVRNAGDLPSSVRQVQQRTVDLADLDEPGVGSLEDDLDARRALAQTVARVRELLPDEREARAVLAVLSGEEDSTTAAARFDVPKARLYQTTFKARRVLRQLVAA